ncbi:unnamed protein product [Phytophthora fragariaefolia]|uniref:Unnamed protein product n=1 Tax=Phytophthora fragariaefolia TaxID=1490495 RepID=A0A9W6YCJ2_9STRA|nr:unnamed protein product [Phytophthora fragariaefolia]
MVHFGDSTTLRVEQCDLSTVRDTVLRLKDKEKETGYKRLPFFIVDEMMPDSSGGSNEAAFQRNVFRLCGLVVMLMDTNSKITNLVGHAKSSFTCQHRWMSVVPRFPKFQRKLFTSAEGEIWRRIIGHYPVVQTIVLHSRGRFSRYFIDEVVQTFQQDSNIQLCDLLDAACARARVSLAMHDGKAFLNSLEGMCSQLMAISYTNTVCDVGMTVAIPSANSSSVGEPAQNKQRVHLMTSAMHKHFANLVKEKITDVTLDTSLKVDGRAWNPMCRFSSMEDDLLLYLAILGGKTCPSYYNAAKDEYLTTKHIFSITNPNEYVVHENSSAPTLDCKRYDNMIAQAIFSSSRRNGVGGIPFCDFLSCLFGEFEETKWVKMEIQVDKADSSLQEVSASDLLQEREPHELLEGYNNDVSALASRTIPFLAPPNTTWPPYILAANKDNCKFGHLVRPPNKERCDTFVVDLEVDQEKAMFVCECKYRGDKVRYGVVKNIIADLNTQWDEGWKVVIVFCTEVTRFRKWGFDSIGCVKIKRGEHPGTVIAKWISQPEPKERKKLMIIFETGLLSVPAS